MHFLLDLHHLGRVLDEVVGQFTDVNQPVLMDAHVHKRAEAGDVGDDAGQGHACPQIPDGAYMSREAEHFERFARVAAGFGQFGHDIGQRGQADGFGDVASDIDPVASGPVLHQFLQGALQIPGHGVHNRVALGVHRAGVQRVGAVGDA